MEATAITNAIETLMSVVTEVISTVTGSPLLMIFLSASLVGIGVSIFRKLKG